MILRPDICSGNLLLVGALLFGGMFMWDHVSQPQVYPVAVTVCGPAPTHLKFISDEEWAQDFVTSFAYKAFCTDEHAAAAGKISPLIRDSFSNDFWTKPACGHHVNFSLQSIEPVDVDADGTSWFEVHGTFTHGTHAPVPVSIAILVDRTPNGGLEIAGFSELTNPMEKLMVSSCKEDCDDKDCEHNDAVPYAIR